MINISLPHGYNFHISFGVPSRGVIMTWTSSAEEESGT